MDTSIIVAVVSAAGAVVAAGFSIRMQMNLNEIREREKILSRYRDPLLHAAYDFQSRIYNTLERGFLTKYHVNGTPEQKKYAEENTVFLVAQFLGWTEIIRRDLRFVDLGSDHETARLRDLQDEIYSNFQRDDVPPAFCLFAGEQRAIGELMIDPDSDEPRCIGYAAFLRDRPRQIDTWLDPLREDVRRMATDPNACRKRLVPLHHSLIQLMAFLDPAYVYFKQSKRRLVGA